MEWPVELLSKMWTGVGDGVGDTPYTVMTTRAPAVLKKEEFWIIGSTWEGPQNIF